uniref:Uncharacterized protein n=1 Tax=Tetraselmis sp. GSL018 TaxID=582737 RepID=A0A061RLH0_9CHLO
MSRLTTPTLDEASKEFTLRSRPPDNRIELYSESGSQDRAQSREPELNIEKVADAGADGGLTDETAEEEPPTDGPEPEADPGTSDKGKPSKKGKGRGKSRARRKGRKPTEYASDGRETSKTPGDQGESEMLTHGLPARLADIADLGPPEDVSKPSPQTLAELKACLLSPYAKLRQAAVERITEYGRHYFEDTVGSGAIQAVLKLLDTEPPRSPMARLVVRSAAVMSVLPGVRSILGGYALQTLMVVKSTPKTLRQPGYLALMNMLADAGVREALIQAGLVRTLLDELLESGEGEDSPKQHLTHVAGALCNIANSPGGLEGISEAGDAEPALVAAVAACGRGLAAQRCALLLERLVCPGRPAGRCSWQRTPACWTT